MSALSFGTTTAAFAMTPGLLTAVLGSPSKSVCGTPDGKRWRMLVIFRAAVHSSHYTCAESYRSTLCQVSDTELRQQWILPYAALTNTHIWVLADL